MTVLSLRRSPKNPYPPILPRNPPIALPIPIHIRPDRPAHPNSRLHFPHNLRLPVLISDRIDPPMTRPKHKLLPPIPIHIAPHNIRARRLHIHLPPQRPIAHVVTRKLPILPPKPDQPIPIGAFD